MAKSKLDGLTDHEILREFVKRFQCDAAILIYVIDGKEYGFTRWRNKIGKQYINYMMNIRKRIVKEEASSNSSEGT